MKALIGWMTGVMLAGAVMAGDWAHWRGPNFDGSSPETGLPQTFNRNENVKWKAALPGPGASTPIIVGDRVFLTAIEEGKGQLLALCLDRHTGKTLWEKNAGSGYRAGGAGTAVQLSSRSNYASPSAVTDGERVVYFFGNGDLVCYDLAGKELWRKNLQQVYGDFCYQWTFSASPTIWDGKVVMQILQRDEPVHGRGKANAESFVVAFDAVTGAEAWKVVRPSDAKKESREAYGTPIPFTFNGRTELLVLGGDVITGHDPATGKELWRWGTWNDAHREVWWRTVPSAVAGGGVILACGPKGCPVHAVKAGLSGTHSGAASVAWVPDKKKSPLATDVPTPAYHDGAFFVVNDLRRKLSRVTAATGEIVWTVDLPELWKYRSSPTVADGRIWLMNHNGQVFTFDPKDGKLLARGEFAEPNDDQIRSSLSVAHGNVYVRTNKHLYCLGD